LPGVPAVSSSQMPTLRHLAGCARPAPRQATTPLHRSGLRHARACLLCPRLTSAERSGRIAPPSVRSLDTPQISRGKLAYLPCIGARFIKYSPLWMEGFAVACQLAPTVPHLVSGSCPSPRTFVPRFLQTPPRGDALAVHLSFGLPGLDRGLTPPSVKTCPAHTTQAERHAAVCASAPAEG
jgi:hypothetical protein